MSAPVTAVTLPLVQVRDTLISSAGNFRCCLATVASEFMRDQSVCLGTRSRCKYCQSEFVLERVGDRHEWKRVVS